MNSDMFIGQWKQWIGCAKRGWSAITGDDAMRIDGHCQSLAGTIQQCYGFTRRQMERRLRRVLSELPPLPRPPSAFPPSFPRNR